MITGGRSRVGTDYHSVATWRRQESRGPVPCARLSRPRLAHMVSGRVAVRQLVDLVDEVETLAAGA